MSLYGLDVASYYKVALNITFFATGFFFYYFCSLDYDPSFIKRIKRLMAKKKLDKETERTPSSPSKIIAIFKNETVHFVIGLMLVIFSVYLLFYVKYLRNTVITFVAYMAEGFNS